MMIIIICFIIIFAIKKPFGQQFFMCVCLECGGTKSKMMHSLCCKQTGKNDRKMQLLFFSGDGDNCSDDNDASGKFVRATRTCKQTLLILYMAKNMFANKYE